MVVVMPAPPIRAAAVPPAVVALTVPLMVPVVRENSASRPCAAAFPVEAAEMAPLMSPTAQGACGGSPGGRTGHGLGPDGSGYVAYGDVGMGLVA